MRRIAAVLGLALAIAAPPLVPSLNAFASAARAADQYGIDVRDRDIYDVVRLLAASTGRQIVLNGNVPHVKVTLTFTASTPDDAIAIFARSQNLVIARAERSIILVRAQDAATQSPEALVTRSFGVRNVQPSVVATSLQSIIPGAQVISDDRGRTVLVRGTQQQIDAAADALRNLDQSSLGRGLSVLSIPTRGKASDVARALAGALSPQAPNQISANDASNAITVTGDADFIARAQATVASYDQYGAQVRFDVEIAEYTPRNDSKNVGLLFGGITAGGAVAAGTGSTATTFANRSISVNATLNALVQRNEARVIANPQISTANNVPGVLDATELYPIITSTASLGATSTSVNYQPIGVRLTMTPTIGPDGAVTANIDASYSGILSFVSGYPIIGNRHATTFRRVADGETIIIAGLIQSNDTRDVQAIPLLSQLPLIGGFFKNLTETHSRSELIFLVTPHVIPVGPQAAVAPPNPKESQ